MTATRTPSRLQRHLPTCSGQLLQGGPQALLDPRRHLIAVDVCCGNLLAPSKHSVCKKRQAEKVMSHFREGEASAHIPAIYPVAHHGETRNGFSKSSKLLEVRGTGRAMIYSDKNSVPRKTKAKLERRDAGTQCRMDFLFYVPIPSTPAPTHSSLFVISTL